MVQTRRCGGCTCDWYHRRRRRSSETWARPAGGTSVAALHRRRRSACVSRAVGRSRLYDHAATPAFSPGRVRFFTRPSFDVPARACLTLEWNTHAAHRRCLPLGPEKYIPSSPRRTHLMPINYIATTKIEIYIFFIVIKNTFKTLSINQLHNVP